MTVQPCPRGLARRQFQAWGGVVQYRRVRRQRERLEHHADVQAAVA